MGRLRSPMPPAPVAVRVVDTTVVGDCLVKVQPCHFPARKFAFKRCICVRLSLLVVQLYVHVAVSHLPCCCSAEASCCSGSFLFVRLDRVSSCASERDGVVVRVAHRRGRWIRVFGLVGINGTPFGAPRDTHIPQYLTLTEASDDTYIPLYPL